MAVINITVEDSTATAVSGASVFATLQSAADVPITVQVLTDTTDGFGAASLDLPVLATINGGTPVFTDAIYKVWAQKDDAFSEPVVIDADSPSNPTITLGT